MINLKKYFIILIFLQLHLFAQKELGEPLIEIFTLIEDSSPNPTGSYSYTLSAVGMVWKVIRTQSTEYYEYDIDYNNEASGGTVYPIINAPYNSYTGFNFIHRRPLNLLNKFSLLWSYDLNFKSTE